MTRIAAHLAALLVVLGILAPQSAGLLAAAGLTKERVLIVCTGDGVRLIQFGTDGAPVEVSEDSQHCALVHTTGTVAAIAPAPAPQRLAIADAGPLTRQPAQATQPVLPSRPRDPPAA